MSKKKKLQKTSKIHSYIAMAVTLSVVLLIILLVSLFLPEAKENTTDTLAQKNTAAINDSNIIDKASNLQESKALLDKLEPEGYAKEDIESSGQYVDGVLFKLSEIAMFSASSGGQSVLNPADDLSDDTAKYTELQSKIDRDRAVYLMVKLKKDFKSVEGVFDEYLLSLQLGIDLNGYLNDKAAYEKARSEKMSGREDSEFITAEQIDRKMLENLQKQNERNRTENLNSGSGNPSGNNSLPGLSQPNPNLPNVDIPRPVDPAEELRKKIGQ